MTNWIVFWLLAFSSCTIARAEAAVIKELVDLLTQNQHQERQLPGVKPRFDAKAQRIDVSGRHAFKAPGPGDQRGPCPGLNALANHNYLPHSGVASISEFILATNRVYGMGMDLAAALCLLGGVFTGDGVKYSIGGATPLVPAPLGGILGTPQGLSNSHNRYESDCSVTRGDLYQYGNAYRLQMSQFKDLLAMRNESGNYNLETMGAFLGKRFFQCINENPYFFHGPVSGLLVGNGAYTFVYRFMGNKSAEYPDGFLDRRVLKSMYAVTGEGDNLIYLPGHERIPENWYKRAIGDEYGLAYFLTDLTKVLIKYPHTISMGGNTGTVNSFFGIELHNLTNGVFNGATLLQGNNLACFIYQALQNALPDAAKPVITLGFTIILALLRPLTSRPGSIGCPQFSQFNSSLFDIFPGYSEYRPGGANDAIQQLVRSLH
nr:PREDICTED: aromatic peroxygenase-like [Bemisia tabaci]